MKRVWVRLDSLFHFCLSLCLLCWTCTRLDIYMCKMRVPYSLFCHYHRYHCLIFFISSFFLFISFGMLFHFWNHSSHSSLSYILHRIYGTHKCSKFVWSESDWRKWKRYYPKSNTHTHSKERKKKLKWILRDGEQSSTIWFHFALLDYIIFEKFPIHNNRAIELYYCC